MIPMPPESQDCFANEPGRDDPCEYDLYALKDFWTKPGTLRDLAQELDAIPSITSIPTLRAELEIQSLMRASIKLALPATVFKHLIDMFRAEEAELASQGILRTDR